MEGPIDRFRNRPAVQGVSLVAALLVLAQSAVAQTVYKWVDENGETHYSQTLPPERVQQEHERMDSGRVAERVDRAMTAEERAELAERIRIERDAEQRRRLQAQQDRLFLAAYPTEEAVRDSIEAQREVLVAELGSVEALRTQARERLNQRLRQAAALQRDGQPVPDHIAEEIRAARANWAELNDRHVRIVARIDGLEQELADEIARFRRLTGTGPATETDSAAEEPSSEDAG